MQLVLASARIGLAHVVIGGGDKKQVDTYIQMSSHILMLMLLQSGLPPRILQVCHQGGNLISNELTKSLVPKIHAIFGCKIAGVLVLPLL